MGRSATALDGHLQRSNHGKQQRGQAAPLGVDEPSVTPLSVMRCSLRSSAFWVLLGGVLNGVVSTQDFPVHDWLATDTVRGRDIEVWA
jgi:hypothetical protein